MCRTFVRPHALRGDSPLAAAKPSTQSYHLYGLLKKYTHSPVLVARLVPVDITFFQDHVLASSNQAQVVRLGAREVVQSHHHLLLVIIIIIAAAAVVVIHIIVVITERSRGEGKMGPPPLEEEEDLVVVVMVIIIIIVWGGGGC